MKTIRDYVSDVRSSFKLVSNDDLISDRYIANELMRTNVKLVMQQLKKRSGLNSPTLFTTLKCIELEEVPLSECCEYQGECTVSKSKRRLPRIVSAKNNLVVQGVWSPDKRYQYKETNPNRYANYLKLGYKKESKFFWMQDGYLYISDPMIQYITISAFFWDPVDPVLHDCTASNTTVCPSNPLDLEFKTIPEIGDDVISIVYQKILTTYKQSSQDPQDDDVAESK